MSHKEFTESAMVCADCPQGAFLDALEKVFAAGRLVVLSGHRADARANACCDARSGHRAGDLHDAWVNAYSAHLTCARSNALPDAYAGACADACMDACFSASAVTCGYNFINRGGAM